MGKNIFITGASSGIGKTIAEYLAGKGHHVLGTSRKKELTNSKFELIPLDVTDQASVHAAIQLGIKKLSTIDVLINNAGYGLYGSLEDTSIKEAKDQFETNYFGVVRMVNESLPHFRANGKGLIINISSMAGLIGMPFQGHYSASKFALEGYTEALRMELKPFNIDICNINPGDFRTTFTSNRRLTHFISPEYQGKFNYFLKLYAEEENNGAGPIMIAELVSNLITRKRSISIRYIIGKKSQTSGIFMKRIVGQKWFEKVMRKMWKV